METSIAIDIVAVGVAIASLFFTIFSFIIACFSLWMMWKINKSTSELTTEHWSKVDKNSEETLKKMNNIEDELKKQNNNMADETFEITKEETKEKPKPKVFITIDDLTELKDEFKDLRENFNELANKNINLNDIEK